VRQGEKSLGAVRWDFLVRMGVGLFFIALALISGVLVLRGAKGVPVTASVCLYFRRLVCRDSCGVGNRSGSLESTQARLNVAASSAPSARSVSINALFASTTRQELRIDE
jgi:hypothetical protein